MKFPNGSRLFFPDQERNKKVPSHLLPVGLGVVNHESLGGRVTAVGTNEDFEMRQRYRRFHSDGSEAMVYKSNDRWEVQLLIPQGASCPSVVARVTPRLWTKLRGLQTSLWNIIATINVGDGCYPFLARKSSFGSGIGYEGMSKDSVNLLRAAVVIQGFG